MKTTVAQPRAAGRENLSDNAARILEARYLRRDEHGSVMETADELFVRVARAIASAEALFMNSSEVSRWEEEQCVKVRTAGPIEQTVTKALQYLARLRVESTDPSSRATAPNLEEK